MNQIRSISPSASVNDPDQDNCLISRLDQVTDRKWSFSVEDHLVINGEVIVLGKLACDDIFRVAFGGCPSEGPGTLTDRLQDAAMDSLSRCSALMGIVQDQPESQPALQPDNGNGTEKTRITRKQLDYAYMLGRDLGMSRDEMADRCLQIYQKKLEFLDRSEASNLIETMKKEKTS